MENIMLKIKGSTITSDGESEEKEELVEFITEGTLQNRGGMTRISYPESEISGMQGCTTSLIVTPDKVMMKRSGGEGISTEMEFQKGKRVDGIYETPYGSMGLEILTNDIVRKNRSRSQTPESLSIDYSISLAGTHQWRQRLDIEIVKNN